MTLDNAFAGHCTQPGQSYPLGATADRNGVNFALFSAHAEAVELCLFDAAAEREIARLPLTCGAEQVWRVYVPDLPPGQAYGYRVHGPYQPECGHRFNPHKLLLDPYARGYAGRFRWDATHYGYRFGDAAGDLSFDERDNAACMLRARVVADTFAWGDDHPRRTPWADTVIVEAHVKGYTMLAADIPVAIRGTYAGLAHPAAIARLLASGATAVELLPVQEFVDEHLLAQHGLVNYWGYNSLGYFAPAARYAGGGEPAHEFKAMVRALHAAGLEVILDVVYNHTAEGDERGPTLSWRGIDNASYYRLAPAARHYADVTGCGNTHDLSQPRVLQLVMDSLRYWVLHLHVDGFRFDLATALARGADGFDAHGALLLAMRQDPLLAQVKLIAEPWDLATWATGRFPSGFAEWNDQYRDTVRGFWLTGATSCGALARRLAGSGDLFRHHGRPPQASINFVTAHDGFTLADLVSYTAKRNAANLQDNRDGTDDNRSIACGPEGPSADPAVTARRQRLQRALLATLVVSQGVPMLLAGDDCGRSQAGNNNAYCQDNALSWIDWATADQSLASFTAALVELRRTQVALRRELWFDGTPTALGEPDITWLSVTGTARTAAEWDDGGNRTSGFVLGRADAGETAILVYLNAAADAVPCRLPQAPAAAWQILLDSSAAAPPLVGDGVELPEVTLLVLGSAPACSHG